MKEVTLSLADETIEILDKVVQMREYYRYPVYQAYSLFIDRLFKDVQRLPLCPVCSCFCIGGR
jgi:hypothetical protein